MHRHNGFPFFSEVVNKLWRHQYWETFPGSKWKLYPTWNITLGPNFIELLKQNILLNNCLLSRNEQDSYKLYMRRMLPVNLILVSKILSCSALWNWAQLELLVGCRLIIGQRLEQLLVAAVETHPSKLFILQRLKLWSVTNFYHKVSPMSKVVCG